MNFPPRPANFKLPARPRVLAASENVGLEASNFSQQGRGRGRTSMPRRRTPGPRGHTDPVYIRVRSCLEIYGLKCSGLCLAADGIVYNKTPEELSPIIKKQLPQIYQGHKQKEDRTTHKADIIGCLNRYGVLTLAPKDEQCQNAEFLEEMTNNTPAWRKYCRLWRHWKIETDPNIPCMGEGAEEPHGRNLSKKYENNRLFSHIDVDNKWSSHFDMFFVRVLLH